MPDRIDEVLDLYRTSGDRRYGEHVTQLEHALQTAWLASRDAGGAVDDELVAAALLHDVAHLLEPEDDGGVDLDHETVGADLLARWFGPGITEPVRLHVEAKRYLCVTDARR